jgi:c-di-GMP-related signal transduction protein
MDAYVARQPIFDSRKNIYAYELLFRDGTANFVPDIDGDLATSTLLSNSFFTIGMDSILGGKKGFINFTQNLLLRKIPLLLSKANTVVEILEDVEPEPDLIAACREISERGYLIALDDFEYSDALQPLIALANFIKFDIRLTPLEQIESYLEPLRKLGCKLLAEKVETPAEFETARQMGFELFQGYFFCKPEIVQGKEIPGSQINLLQVIAEVNKSEFEFRQLEQLVSRDTGLAYKLLRYINSAFFAKANKISSIKQALIFLGQKEIRRFVSLAAMSKLATGKPHELIRASCVRGKLCELIGTHSKGHADASELSTLGMFSLLDAITDQPMERIMRTLPLSLNIKEALIARSGRLVDYLWLIEDYEKGLWREVQEKTLRLGMAEDTLPSLYLKACNWSNTISDF